MISNSSENVLWRCQPLKNNVVFTSGLKDRLNDFLKYKRLCGYKYVNEAFLLVRFDKFIKESKYDTVHLSKEAVYAWLNLNSSQSSKSKALKCSLLREFGVYLNTYGFKAFILPNNAVRKTKSDFTPYIFSKEELVKFFIAVDNSKLGLHKNESFHLRR